MITFHDFGAGLPGDNLSAAQMEQGRTVTRSVADVVNSGSPGTSGGCFCSISSGDLTCHVRGNGQRPRYVRSILAAALALNGRGLVTAEGAPTFATARQHLDALGLSAVRIVVGRFQDTLDGILREHGRWTTRSSMGTTIATRPSPTSSSSCLTRRTALPSSTTSLYYPSMQRAWRMMAAHPHVRVAADLGRFGLCVMGGPGPSEKPTCAWRS
jgi:hypothetical protein